MEEKSVLFKGISYGVPAGEKGVIGPSEASFVTDGKVAVLPAQPRLRCVFDPHSLACRNLLILALIHRPTLNGPRPSRRRSRPSPKPTIPTLHSGSEISRCLQPATCCRLPAG